MPELNNNIHDLLMIKPFISYISLTLFLTVCFSQSCDRHADSGMTDILAHADTLLLDNPDSALRVLGQLPAGMDDPETAAWRDLLTSKALAKAHRPLPPDSLLKRTAACYAGRGDSLETQSLYYYGFRLLVDEQYEDALPAFHKVYNIALADSDFFYTAMASRSIGDIYGSFLNTTEELFWTDKSVYYFDRANKPIHKTVAQLTAINALLYIDKDKAKERFSKIEKSENSYLKRSYRNVEFDMAYVFKDHRAVIELARTFTSLSSIQWGKLAESYIALKNVTAAKQALDSAGCYMSTAQDSLNYIQVKSEFLHMTGNFNEASESSKEWAYGVTIYQQNLLDKPAIKPLTEHYKNELEINIRENDSNKRQLNDTIIISLVVVFSLIVFIIFIVIRNKRKRTEYFEKFKSLQQELNQVMDSRSELRFIFESELTAMNNALQHLYMIKSVSNKSLDSKYNEFLKEFTSPEMINSIEKIINNTYDDWMNRFRTAYPNLKPVDYILTIYIFVGFRSKFISLVLNKTEAAINSAKSHLKQRIIKEHSNMEAEVLKRLKMTH